MSSKYLTKTEVGDFGTEELGVFKEYLAKRDDGGVFEEHLHRLVLFEHFVSNMVKGNLALRYGVPPLLADIEYMWSCRMPSFDFWQEVRARAHSRTHAPLSTATVTPLASTSTSTSALTPTPKLAPSPSVALACGVYLVVIPSVTASLISPPAPPVTG
jgi:hypothetical protein